MSVRGAEEEIRASSVGARSVRGETPRLFGEAETERLSVAFWADICALRGRRGDDRFFIANHAEFYFTRCTAKCAFLLYEEEFALPTGGASDAERAGLPIR